MEQLRSSSKNASACKECSLWSLQEPLKEWKNDQFGQFELCTVAPAPSRSRLPRPMGARSSGRRILVTFTWYRHEDIRASIVMVWPLFQITGVPVGGNRQMRVVMNVVCDAQQGRQQYEQDDTTLDTGHVGRRKYGVGWNGRAVER